MKWIVSLGIIAGLLNGCGDDAKNAATDVKQGAKNAASDIKEAVNPATKDEFKNDANKSIVEIDEGIAQLSTPLPSQNLIEKLRNDIQKARDGEMSNLKQKRQDLGARFDEYAKTGPQNKDVEKDIQNRIDDIKSNIADLKSRNESVEKAQARMAAIDQHIDDLSKQAAQADRVKILKDQRKTIDDQFGQLEISSLQDWKEKRDSLNHNLDDLEKKLK